MSYQTGPQAVYIKSTFPTATDDLDAGYFVGARWLDTTARTSWTLIDNTVGAAIWVTVSAYVHVQAVAALVWNVTHNLGARPNVEVRNSSGEVVIAHIQHTGPNSTTITFSEALAGEARFSS